MEQVDSLVLEGQERAHLGRQTARLGSGIRRLCVLHQHLEQGHVGVTGWRVECDKNALIATDKILQDVKNDALIFERLDRGLEKADQGSDEDGRLEADSHFFQEALARLEVQIRNVKSEVNVFFVLVFFDEGDCALHIVAHLIYLTLPLFSGLIQLRFLLSLAPATALIVKNLLLRCHRGSFVLILCGLLIALLGVILWDINCMIALNRDVFIHKTFGYFQEYEQTFASDITHRVLQVCNYMLRQSKIQTSLDLIAITSLKD